MNAIKMAILGLFALMLAGCAAKGWVLEDNSPVAPDQLKAAKTTCKIEDRLYNFRYTEITYNATARIIKDPVARAKLEETFQTKKQKLHTEIENCMNKQGLKRKG